MRAVVLNVGSETIKYALLDLEGNGRATRLASGTAEREGKGFRTRAACAGVVLASADHEEFVRALLARLAETGGGGARLDAVGHRVVHGGEAFVRPTRLDAATIERLEALSPLAPLHNPFCVRAIRAATEVLGDAVPQVAVFDTAFHATIPPEAATYAIARALARRHGVRRYGFHGIAHAWLLDRYLEISGRPREKTRVVTLHLGGGASACAIRGGRSVETSMGLTPLEGLVMATRSGDLDPALVGFLARAEGISLEEVERSLCEESGLLGLSGRSADMREILEAAARGDEAAALARDAFVHRARKYLGAYLAVLEGAEAVLFGGGIGENAPPIREGICRDMEWCGLRLDRARNAAVVGKEGAIHVEGSRVAVLVIPVDEELSIARETAACLGGAA